jgi:hypothetical protein
MRILINVPVDVVLNPESEDPIVGNDGVDI